MSELLSDQRKFILMGASRGLGHETYRQLSSIFSNQKADFLLCSRKQPAHHGHSWVQQDFSKVPANPEFLNQLESFAATDLIYFAGGGPYGSFAAKKWSDHLWALNTSFLFPAELLHHILASKAQPRPGWASLKKFIVIGSSVAEARPDPMAASYAAAKHALRGLIDTVNAEQLAQSADEASRQNPPMEVQIFSPGYMQTDLLPLNSRPRQQQQAEPVGNVAKKLIDFIEGINDVLGNRIN